MSGPRNKFPPGGREVILWQLYLGQPRVYHTSSKSHSWQIPTSGSLKLMELVVYDVNDILMP
eukprot:1711889-Pleurochrysis_carterae.AAC.2